MHRSFFTAVAIVVAQAAVAGSISQAHITQIAINKKDYGSMLFLATDGQKTSSPTCQANGYWSFVMPLNDSTDKAMLAILLSARVTQTPITLTGNGQCDVMGSIETLVYPNY